ncbi:MAG TPA: hypothetical protein VIK35_11965 [Verrucomicrobiae bacterium]
MNKHRMNAELSSFAARLRFAASRRAQDRRFEELALELFALQFKHNSAYRKICEARGRTPKDVGHWTHIPAVPAAAFKELDLTSLSPDERTSVFYSSGTTVQKAGRHFHNAESLAVYEASAWAWFGQNIFKNPESGIQNPELLALTPPPSQAPQSSLVHMFETVRQKMDAPESAFAGKLAADGAWTLDFEATVAVLRGNSKLKTQIPKLILGIAFSFVHLLDYLAENNLQFRLPENSRVMETGGYKNRSRSLPKSELHALITERLGIAPGKIICEYGMSELSSQAYDSRSQKLEVGSQKSEARSFHFPPWARVQIISPEINHEVAEGETGLIRVFDLANIFSVAAVQTEDLGIRRADGFELVGRAQLAGPRGCSLLAA